MKSSGHGCWYGQLDENFPRTITHSILELIRDAIVSGDYAPGQRLTIMELSERYDVSTMPIRTALQQLESEGLIAIHPHRGATITELTPREIDEIYEMRVPLEAMAIRAAIPNMTDAVVDEAEESALRMRTPSGPLESVQLNNRFHMTLYVPSGRTHLLDIIHRLRSRVQHYLPLYGFAELDDIHQEHHDLVKACRARDVVEAERITVKHLVDGARKIRGAVAKNEAPHYEEEERDELEL